MSQHADAVEWLAAHLYGLMRRPITDQDALGAALRRVPVPAIRNREDALVYINAVRYAMFIVDMRAQHRVAKRGGEGYAKKAQALDERIAVRARELYEANDHLSRKQIAERLMSEPEVVGHRSFRTVYAVVLKVLPVR